MTSEDIRVELNHHVQHRYPEHCRFCPMCGGELAVRTVMPDLRRNKVCKVCGFVHFLGPKLVAGCLLIRDGGVLLLKRAIKPGFGLWTFPGGYVELGESAVEAARRETLEEVGMEVRVGRILGLYSDPANAIATVAVYLAEPGAAHPATSQEASEVRYFAPEEIPWHELAFVTTRDALREWIELQDRRP